MMEGRSRESQTEKGRVREAEKENMSDSGRREGNRVIETGR